GVLAQEAVDVLGSDGAAGPAGRLHNEHGLAPGRDRVGGGKACDPRADDDDHAACTAATRACTWSTGVSGRMPCPRLNICPGAARPARTISAALPAMTSGGANKAHGSRLPWTGRDPSRPRAWPRSTRKSMPITSAPERETMSRNG